MDIKAKLRPFYVAKMLYEQTDEDHYLTIAQIMEQLEKDYGISTSRGTVGDDIKALQELELKLRLFLRYRSVSLSLAGDSICRNSRP